ncbi:MAG: DNA-directed RNA polymerase subunit P [Candidatus Diapherotrites archaeon]
MYRCSNCGEKCDTLSEGIIRCPKCASKVLYKIRDPIVKDVIAR